MFSFSNVGGIDRVLRIVAGLALLAVYFVQGSMWGLIGIVPLATGLLGYCPAYSLFGFKTCPLARHG